MSQWAADLLWPCHNEQQSTGGHVTVGGMSQWAAGQWWPCHYGGHVTVGSRSVVAMSLWGPCQSGEQVSGPCLCEVMSQWAAVQWWPCHCEVTSQCAAGQWWPCHSEQQATGCHVTVGGMSQWAAGQWWPCHYGGYVTVVSGSVVAMSLYGPCDSEQHVSSDCNKTYMVFVIQISRGKRSCSQDVVAEQFCNSLM